MAFTRKQILERLQKSIDAGIPIIGGGAGTGISAKFEEAGGVDLMVIYNSGRFRMAGRGSLAGCMPYGDANAIVMEMANEVRGRSCSGHAACKPRSNGPMPTRKSGAKVSDLGFPASQRPSTWIPGRRLIIGHVSIASPPGDHAQ